MSAMDGAPRDGTHIIATRWSGAGGAEIRVSWRKAGSGYWWYDDLQQYSDLAFESWRPMDAPVPMPSTQGTGKPAWHLIDVEAGERLIDSIHGCDDVGLLLPSGQLNRWTGGRGDNIGRIVSAFAAVAHMYNTDNPKHTARLELARVLAFGHEGGGHAVVPSSDGRKWSKMWRSAYGHIQAHKGGEMYDADSGLMHLSHALGQLMILYVHQRGGLGTDDRAEVWPV